MHSQIEYIVILLNVTNCVFGKARLIHIIQGFTNFFERTLPFIFTRLLVQHQVVKHLGSSQRHVLILVEAVDGLAAPVKARSFIAIKGSNLLQGFRFFFNIGYRLGLSIFKACRRNILISCILSHLVT